MVKLRKWIAEHGSEYGDNHLSYIRIGLCCGSDDDDDDIAAAERESRNCWLLRFLLAVYIWHRLL